MEELRRVALLQVLSMWLFHDSLLFIVTPKYLLSVSVSKTCHSSTQGMFMWALAGTPGRGCLEVFF